MRKLWAALEPVSADPSPSESFGRARVAAIIPVLNEADAIENVVRAVPRDSVDDVIVVDGGSRDATRTVAEQAGAIVVLEERRGYGRACATGAETAIKRGAAWLIFLDGDGSDRPEHVPELLKPLLAGCADFVIASRVRGTREAGSMGLHQLWAGLLIGRAIGWLYGVRYSDMCAFRAIGAGTLRRLGMREMTYGWNLEMQMRAARIGLRVVEVPVTHARRVGGQSKVSGTLRGTIKAGARILATIGRVALERRT
jgi:glycosyltransferase involved in cell wall biosynthesis